MWQAGEFRLRAFLPFTILGVSRLHELDRFNPADIDYGHIRWVIEAVGNAAENKEKGEHDDVHPL